jgi:hypothetical protein
MKINTGKIIGRTIGWALTAAVSLWAHDGNHGGLVLSAVMDGAQEVPAVETSARGLMGFKMNEAMDTVWIEGAVSGLGSAITKLHLHAGKRGEAGAVAVDLMPYLHGNSVSAVWTGFSRADLAAMLRGAYYVNLHTADKPAGELRGQVEMERDRVFTADIMGWDEVPAVETSAKGVGIFQLSPDDSLLRVSIGLDGLDSITGAHLHQGPAGSNGTVVANLFGALAGNAIDTVIPVSSLASPAAFVDSLKKGSLYFNVHTKAHGTGEIRGQLRPQTERTMLAALEGEHEVPAVEGEGEGLGYFSLSPDDSTLTVRVVFDGLDSVTAAHIHKGATGANGGALVNLASLISGHGISGEVKISALADPAGFVDALVRGGLYVNVHTKAHGTGAIRGQLLFRARDGFVFRMDGSHEVPAVTSGASGVGIATMAPDHADVRFFALADGLYGDLKASHFHKGAAGVNGPAALNITQAFHGPFASGVWTARDSVPFTHDLAAAFLTGGLYLNVHSDYYPAGEIRGQVADPAGQAPAAVRFGAARAAAKSRALLSGDGRGLRIQGAPGSIVNVTVADASGRARAGYALRLDGDGVSSTADISALAPGLYFASWRDAEAGPVRSPLLRR